VKFGLFYQLPCAPDQSEPARYNETIDQIIHADELGFDIAWLAELHFYRPFSIMPAPLVVAAAIARQTRRIRLGTAVTLLALHQPLRAAAEAATVDILSGGRFDFGVGRGTIALHFTGLNLPREESRTRFEEALEVIEKAWTRERFSHHGRHFQIPEVSLVPRPLQKPHPPIRVAANSAETAEFAGRLGYDVLVAAVINPIPGLYDHIRKYREALARAGHQADRRNVAALIFTYTAQSRAQARKEYEPSIMHYFRTVLDQVKLGGGGQSDNSYRYLQHVRENEGAMTWDGIERTMGIFGDPDECIGRINEIHEGSRINQIVCWFNPGGLIPHRDVMAAMERFADRVIPAVRKLGE
jgi:alkanesulfonate monooxygenase SsuD/methylene tetrahydromethanopterin reductase-like flavin-dependent oxidoreductase (luciferase family)